MCNFMINRIAFLFLICCYPFAGLADPVDDVVRVTTVGYSTPALLGSVNHSLMRVEVSVLGDKPINLSHFTICLSGQNGSGDIENLRINYLGDDFNGGEGGNAEIFGEFAGGRGSRDVVIKGYRMLSPGQHYFMVSVNLSSRLDLGSSIACTLIELGIGDRKLNLSDTCSPAYLRPAVAVRQHMQDGVHTSRIPGLATTNKGTLLAIFDARYESARDLQGHMDIGLHRSTDGGQIWEPLQIVMDMGEWGGLPQKFNGVSDACILVDKNSDAIYIAGLWMYGVINDDGKWVEGLADTSTVWNHQWRTKGSQPGFGVKETSQFLVVKSTDDGKTWGKPLNLTEMCKRQEWWLWAPAPGNGITMTDGTLVFPTQGRDATGKPFSNITFSKDGGRTWQTSNPALDVPAGTTECAVVELSDGSLMLNMRANSNRGNEGADNGRAISITTDLGESWREHSTSFRALPEPTCMASLYKHTYTVKGVQKQVLLFLNPNSKIARDHITLKVSFDDGHSWPAKYWILLDEGRGRGYSCITSVDEDHIGVLYEGSRADLVFQKIPLADLLTTDDFSAGNNSSNK